MPSRKLLKHKNIAIVAHNNRKQELIKWVTENKDRLEDHHLVGTGDTAEQIQSAIGKNVIALLSGPYGGDQQLGSMIAEQKVDMLIFFWDALEPQAHDSDIKALQRLAVLWNIPFACNRATIDFILNSSLFDNEYEAQLPE